MITGPIRYVIAGLLLLGVFELPYGFYGFLRIVVTLYAVVLAYSAYKNRANNVMYLWIGIAILFNPLLPIYLGKEIWVVLDLLTAGLIAFSQKLIGESSQVASKNE